MRWLQPENPSHVHIRSLRMRFLIPLLVACVAVIAIAISTVFGLAAAARKDAAVSMHALARASATAVMNDTSADGLPDGAITYALDARGNVVRGPSADQAGRKLDDDALFVEVLSGKEGAVTLRGADGRSFVYGYTRATGQDGAPGYAIVGLPADAVFASLRDALYSWAILGSALALLALAAAAALGDLLLVRRTRRLAAAMRSVVAGDLQAKDALVRGLGELDEVTEIFDAITVKLQQAYATTESKVKKRTVELEFNKGMAELDKARTEALLTSIGDGLFATDNEGKITFINQEGERMLGFSGKELETNFAQSFLRLEDDKGTLIAEDKRPTSIAISAGKKYQSPVYPKPYYFVRKDKSRFPAQITVTPVLAGGTVAGTIQVFRDITAEVEFDRRKSEFISIASHQLRSPLSATKWLSDMLRKGDAGKLQEKQQQLADKLFDANERMVVLVNELLNVSRLESGTVKLAPQETDVAKLVDGVLTESAPLLLQKQQTFEKSLGEVPPLTLDQTLIREVTANIISNASKYSPPGGTIAVAVRREGEEVTVSVKDQGMGIPQSDQTQMFKKFFRADNATKSVVSGTGLGLYVCKAIVELHGGRIWFESAQDKGTTFFFTLPVKGAPIKAGEVHLT